MSNRPIRTSLERSTGSPEEAFADWRQMVDLLEAGQFENAAWLLNGFKDGDSETDRTHLELLLAAAYQICLACHQAQQEMEWHRRSYQGAIRRAEELMGQLDTLLSEIIQYQRSMVLKKEWWRQSEPGMATTTEEQKETSSVERPHDWWQRIKGALAMKKDSGDQEDVSAVHATSRASAQRGNIPPLSSSDTLRTSTRSLEIMQNSDELHLDHNAPSSTAEKNAQAGGNVYLQATHSDPSASRRRSRGKSGAPSLVVYTLGAFRVFQNEKPIETWPSSKGKSIFKYLITHSQRPVPKEVLMEQFWRDADPTSARNNLNVAIYGLRQALRSTYPAFSHVLFQDDCYLFNPKLDIWLDCEAFSVYLRNARTLEQRGDFTTALHEYNAAEALYQGEFLEEDRYEDWPIPMRAELSDDYLGLLERLSHHYLDGGDLTASVSICRKMLAVDPCREEAHRRLMRCYNQLGQPYLALRQYHLCADALIQELDVPPSPATKELYDSILAGAGKARL